MHGPADQGRDERVRVVADRLRIDAVTARVGRAFDEAGITSILLKGASIDRWLYTPDEPRGYRDCDLLVAPGQVDDAEAVLGGLGLTRRYDVGGLPAWWGDHAHEWWSEEDGVWVDLHHRLPGLGVDDDQAWRTLSATTQAVVVAGYPARALAIPARALNVVLHSAHHGEAWGKVLADLERALEIVDDSAWVEAADLAARLGATDSFAAGLRLVGGGAALADRLGLPRNQSVEAALRVGMPPPMALTFEQVASAPGLRAKMRLIARKLVPPRGFMRHWHPRAASSRWQLLLAYVYYRPAWLFRNARRGWRAWRDARRSVRSGPR